MNEEGRSRSRDSVSTNPGRALPPPPAPPLRLRIDVGPLTGTDLAIDRTLLVGRSHEADIVLPETDPDGPRPFASRRHFEVSSWGEGGALLVNHSRNGTVVNRLILDGAAHLRAGSIVQVGGVTMAIVEDAAAPAGLPACRALLGRAPAMDVLRRDIARLGPRAHSVLIWGETGTGKELVARALHDASGRRGRFVAINCGALRGELMESELFGHERGAFTGAVARKLGLFEVASGGTVFLDEIAELAEPLQVVLLRALQSRTIRRVGSDREIPIDVLVVSATHGDLASSRPKLRHDLYHRLAQGVIEVPALRRRGSDVLLLAVHFLDHAAERLGEEPKVLTPEAEAAILAYAWPGNVRELQNAMECAALRTEAVLLPEHVIPRRPGAPVVAAEAPSVYDASHSATLLKRALDEAGGNRAKAADALGLPRSTAYEWSKRFGLDEPRGPRRRKP